MNITNHSFKQQCQKRTVIITSKASIEKSRVKHEAYIIMVMIEIDITCFVTEYIIYLIVNFM